MDITFANRLIEILPQYEDRRIEGTLRQGDCYCAIGVACDLLVQENPDRFSWVETNSAQDSSIPGTVYAFRDINERDTNFVLIPNAVGIRLGLNISSQMMGQSDDGVPFTEIAEYVKRETRA